MNCRIAANTNDVRASPSGRVTQTNDVRPVNNMTVCLTVFEVSCRWKNSSFFRLLLAVPSVRRGNILPRRVVARQKQQRDAKIKEPIKVLLPTIDDEDLDREERKAWKPLRKWQLSPRDNHEWKVHSRGTTHSCSRSNLALTSDSARRLSSIQALCRRESFGSGAARLKPLFDRLLSRSG